jgi:hypothetical protein
VPDGCGGTVACGSQCAPGQTCGGAATGNNCGCTPRTCQPGWCGSVPNGCGGTLSCNPTCGPGETCGGGGVAGLCGSKAALQSGFRWDGPAPSGAPIFGLWMSATEGWATSGGGNLLHYRNGAWSAVNSGTDWTWAVSGASPSDVWFAQDQSHLRHWNGSSMDPVATVGSTTRRAVPNRGAGESWAAGDSGSIAHYNGTWTVVQSSGANLHGIYAVAPNDVWAVGENGTILHGGSGGFSSGGTPPGPLGQYGAVWGTSSTDVWIAGDNGVFHWNGGGWSQAQGLPGGFWRTLTGTGTNDVWAAGAFVDANNKQHSLIAHWNGSAWTTHGEWIGGGRYLMAASSDSPNSTWLAGQGGALIHFDGVAFSSNVSVPPLRQNGFTRIWGSSRDDVWFAADEPEPQSTIGTGLLHFDGVRLVTVPFPYVDHVVGGAAFQPSMGVAMVNADPDAVLMRWDGNRWSEMQRVPGATATATWASSPQDGWGALQTPAGTGFVHLSGGAPISVAAPPGTEAITSIWGATANDVWAAAGTNILHFDGHQWSTSYPASGTVVAVHGTSGTDVWAVGAMVLHFDGAHWTNVSTPAPPGATFSSVWAASAGNVFVASPNSGWMRMVNGTWQPMNNPPWSRSVWGSSATDVYLGGANAWNGLAHWDGSNINYNIGPANLEGAVNAHYLNNGGMLLAIQDGQPFMYDNWPRQWTPWHGLPQPGDGIVNFWGSNWMDAYYVTQNGAIWHDTQSGMVHDYSITPADALLDVWGAGAPHANDNGLNPATDIWAVGLSGCWHGDGKGNYAQLTGAATCSGRAVYGSSNTDVWVVGSGSAAFHCNASSCTSFALPGGNWTGVWAFSTSLAYAVGFDANNHGIAAVWNGSAWSSVNIGFVPGVPLVRVWGTSASRVYAAGPGLLLTYNGSSWTADWEPIGGDPVGLTGLDSSTAALVTSEGVVLKPTGTLP